MRKYAIGVTALGAVLLGLAIGVLIGRAWTLDVDFMLWMSNWLRSAGFGGTAALGAALIALGAAHVTSSRQMATADQDRSQREAAALAQSEEVERAARRAEWWSSTQWALALAMGDRADVREIGFDVLVTLSESELATDSDQDLFAAIARTRLEDLQ